MQQLTDAVPEKLGDGSCSQNGATVNTAGAVNRCSHRRPGDGSCPQNAFERLEIRQTGSYKRFVEKYLA